LGARHIFLCFSPLTANLTTVTSYRGHLINANNYGKEQGCHVLFGPVRLRNREVVHAAAIVSASAALGELLEPEFVD